MTQNKARDPKRRNHRLSARERRRILKERKMRRMRRRFFALLALLAVLLIVLMYVLADLRKRDQLNYAPLTMQPSVSESAVAASLPTNSPEPKYTPEPTHTPGPTPSTEPIPTLPIVLDAATEGMPQALDPSDPFSYEQAYAAAVLGADTGAPILADLSSVDPAKLARWPEAQEGFMPMLSRANTTEKIIAVTVDDCFQADNLSQIVKCALDNGAKLTIFPIGTNLEKQSVAQIIRTSWECGMEIENHTYSHKGTYHYDDNGMASDIFRQSVLLDRALGVNYKQHFFRPKGGDERFDQRTHAYIRQNGFAAMALWTQSGSVDPMDSLLEGLAPGNIYLFHTTDNDLKKIQQFIPAAVQAGYRLVTLNEMFGLPANETAALSTAPTEAPPLASFRVQAMTLKATAYARASAVVQARLIELGWMHGEPTGVYGKTTAACVKLFQSAVGIAADGVAGHDTQLMLFSPDAPTASVTRIRELMLQTDSATQAAIDEMLSEYP